MSDYAENTKIFNATDNGITWLNIDGTYDGYNQQSGASQVDSYINANGELYSPVGEGEVSGFYVYSSKMFLKGSAKVEVAKSGAPSGEYWEYGYFDFEDSSDNQLFRVKVDIKNSGVDADYIYVYNESDGLLNQTNFETNNNMGIYINWSLDENTNNMTIIIYDYINGLERINTSFILSNCVAPKNFYFYTKPSSYTGYMKTFYFKLKDVSSLIPWDIEYDSFGAVETSSINEFEVIYHLLTVNYIDNEIQNQAFAYTEVDIKQLAIPVKKLTNLSNFQDIKARVNGIDLGSYDNAHTWYSDERQVLVWENLDITLSNVNKLLVEMLAIRKSGETPELRMYQTDTDIDFDNDMNYKYTFTNTYYDGLYNAPTSESRDFLYQVWYNVTGESGIEYYTLPTDPWLSFGSLNPYAYGVGFPPVDYARNDKYVEIQRNMVMSAEIKQVELLVDYYFFYGTDRSLSSFDLYCNNVNLGNPDKQLIYNNWNERVLVWENLSQVITNEKPVLEFAMNEKAVGYGEYYWYGYGYTPVDVDNDGDTEFSYHSMSSIYGDGQYSIYSNQYTSNYDLSYRTWYIATELNVTNSISVTPLITNQYDTVTINYQSNKTVNSFITVENSTSEVFNSSIEISKGRKYYTPISTDGDGTFTCYLIIDGIKTKNSTFTVNAVSSDWRIWTENKYPSLLENVKLYYNIPDGEIGYLYYELEGIVKSIENLLGGSDTQDFITSFGEYGNWQLKLKQNVNGTYVLKDTENIYVESGERKNYIDLYSDKTTISDYVLLEYDPSITLGDNVVIKGTHTYVGDMGIHVTIPSLALDVTVEGQNDIFIVVRPNIAGDYIAYLKYNDEILDTKPFTIVSPEDVTPTLPVENFVLKYINMLDNFYKLLLGVGICVGLMFSPLIIMSKLDIEVEIPIAIYVMLGCLGVIICIAIGLWGWEIPFFICFMAILTTIVLWLRGRD
jgi:hypothetical protein